MNNVLLVFIGGGIGSVARLGISEIIRAVFRSNLPVATLLSNLLSCLILALVAGPLSARVEPGLKTFLIVGLCGGFSTFSTFSYETVELMRTGHLPAAIANILISVIACTGIIWFISKTS